MVGLQESDSGQFRQIQETFVKGLGKIRASFAMAAVCKLLGFERSGALVAFGGSNPPSCTFSPVFLVDHNQPNLY